MLTIRNNAFRYRLVQLCQCLVKCCCCAELRRTDTGWYTCKAISETGETAWSGSLSVEAPTDPSIIFRRTPDPSTYPGPPSRPVVSDVRETSVRLAWKPNPNNGASPVSAFTVEYFSHETGQVGSYISARAEISIHSSAPPTLPDKLSCQSVGERFCFAYAVRSAT